MTERVTPARILSEDEWREAPQWRYKITVAGESFSSVEEGKVSYDEDGSSELSCIVDTSQLPAFETSAKNRRCDVHVRQRGDESTRETWRHLFTGLVRHSPTDELGYTDLHAVGPRGLLDRASFVKRRTYSNTTLDNFVYDIDSRIRNTRLITKIRAGQSFVVTKRQFQGETSLLEGLDQVMESAISVAIDRPGFVLLVTPIPRPGVRSTALGDEFYIGPEDYGPGDLKVPESEEGPFGQVIAFRRNPTSGLNDIEVSQFVRGAGEDAAENEVFWISEFPGSFAQAQKQVALMADLLEAGMYEPTVNTVEFERPIYTYQPAVITQDRIVAGTTKRIILDAVVKSSTLDLVEGKYDLKFDAVRSKIKTIHRPWDPDPISPYLVRTTAGQL